MPASTRYDRARRSPGVPRRVAPRRRPPKGPTPLSPATEQIETEWQFDVPRLDVIEDWLGKLPKGGDVEVGRPTMRRVRDLYLDTRDWKVFRAGYALRIRKVGRGVESTLKAVTPREGGPVVRREITQPVAEAAQASIFASSGPVAERLRRFCTARELRVLSEVRTARRRFPIRVRGAAAGEVTLDRCLVAGERGPGSRMLRVEIEVPAGMVESLRPFVEQLRASDALTPSMRSKYEWALAAKHLEPVWPRALGTDRVDPTMTLGQAAYAVLRRHFAVVLWDEPGTRLGEDPEHLHDMRVATRRMRAALRVFASALPARETMRLRRELRVLGQALGAVRDRDVQREQIQAWRGALVTVEPGALDPLLTLLDTRRHTARTSLLQRLDLARTKRLMASLEVWLRRGTGVRQPGASRLLRAAAPQIIRRARKKLMRQAKTIEPDSPPAAYHRVRILGKRLRYALEFVEPLYGDPARALIDALVELQDILGRHQDAQVCIKELPVLAREGRLPSSTRAAVAEIAQLYVAQAARQRELYPTALRKLRNRNWRALEQAMEESLLGLAADVVKALASDAAGKGGRSRAAAISFGAPIRPPRKSRQRR